MLRVLNLLLKCYLLGHFCLPHASYKAAGGPQKRHYLLEHSGGVFTYLHEPHDHVVQVDIAQRCMVFAFSSHLIQE